MAIRVLDRVGDEGSYEDMYDYKFITYIGVQGDGSDPKITDVIDKWSFRQTSPHTYQDKNNVYYHRSHSDGGYLLQTGIDANTFKMIGQCYAQDKDYIYYISGSSGVGAMDIDSKTFKTCFGCGCVAKDKNSTYLFGDKIDLKNFTDAEITSLFASLEHL